MIWDKFYQPIIFVAVSIKQRTAVIPIQYLVVLGLIAEYTYIHHALAYNTSGTCESSSIGVTLVRTAPCGIDQIVATLGIGTGKEVLVGVVALAVGGTVDPSEEPAQELRRWGDRPEGRFHRHRGRGPRFHHRSLGLWEIHISAVSQLS